ncbi:MFS transporter [Granulosicoccus antarcticus]|uniref:Putative MFS-type transporter YcaD n=1 Tax=Granulosicoccus antarcticus IMCC3135 TaxID=1192854 RepID=A0A2Z2P1M3_9GAMM|nr:MFS transporter [Granulosicoccus antarcticus]ASJ76735.1 putative MFS-type transporter YcaD [Granulosicoccus antarcticus IMCC3135]
MFLVLKQTWALMLGVLLLMLGNGLQGTLLGVRGSLEHIDSGTMGFIMAGYFVGFLGGSKLTPIMLQRVGHVRVFAALGSLVSAAFILYAAVVDPIAWWLLRVLVGFCFSGIYVVAESWLNHSASNSSRGQALSLYLIVQMAGMVLGQLLLNVADPGGYNLFVLITVLVSISFAPMLLSSSSSAPLQTAARPMPLKELIRTSPLACVGILLLGGVYSVLYAMSPVYATERGLSIAQTSYFITAIFLGAMVFQFPIGWLSDRIDRRILIIGVTAVGAASSLFGLYVGENFIILLVIAVLLGGAANPTYSLLVAYANDYLEQDQMAAAAGGLLFINGFGAMTGPILVGYAMTNLGIEWYFITLFLLLSCISLYGIYRISQRAHLITDESAPYLPLSARSSGLATSFALEAAEESHLEELEDSEEVFESRLYDNEVLERMDEGTDNTGTDQPKT